MLHEGAGLSRRLFCGSVGGRRPNRNLSVAFGDRPPMDQTNVIRTRPRRGGLSSKHERTLAANATCRPNVQSEGLTEHCANFGAQASDLDKYKVRSAPVFQEATDPGRVGISGLTTATSVSSREHRRLGARIGALSTNFRTPPGSTTMDTLPEPTPSPPRASEASPIDDGSRELACVSVASSCDAKTLSCSLHQLVLVEVWVLEFLHFLRSGVSLDGLHTWTKISSMKPIALFALGSVTNAAAFAALSTRCVTVASDRSEVVVFLAITIVPWRFLGKLDFSK